MVCRLSSFWQASDGLFPNEPRHQFEWCYSWKRVGVLVNNIANDNNYKIEMLRINLGSDFVVHGTRDYLHSSLGIDPASILGKAKKKWPHLFSEK